MDLLVQVNAFWVAFRFAAVSAPHTVNGYTPVPTDVNLRKRGPLVELKTVKRFVKFFLPDAACQRRLRGR